MRCGLFQDSQELHENLGVCRDCRGSASSFASDNNYNARHTAESIQMSGLIPVLLGANGIAEGEFFVLGDQAVITIGRSRACDVSFQRFRKYLALPEVDRARQDEKSAMISRLHLRIKTQGTKVTAENLSSVGSSCNDKRFTTTLEWDLTAGNAVFRLGSADEIFTLTRLTQPAVEELLVPTLQPPTKRIRKPDAHPAEDPTLKNTPALPDIPTDLKKGIGDSPTSPSVTFPVAGGGKRTQPLVSGEELLAFLEHAGAACADRGCGMGSCHSCKLTAVKGRSNVTMITDYDDSGLEPDEFLPCCSTAVGPLEVVKA